jgi:hypothetical protein
MNIIVTYESVLFTIVELFLVSTCSYRNQNLVSPQEPQGKGRVVSGPYGIAHYSKASFLNPRQQFRFVFKVALLAPKTGIAHCSHPSDWNLTQSNIWILWLWKGFKSVRGRHHEAYSPLFLNTTLSHGGRHLDLLPHWLLGYGSRHRHFYARSVVSGNIPKEPVKRLVSSLFKISFHEGFGEDMEFPNLSSDMLVRVWYLRYANRIFSKIKIGFSKSEGSSPDSSQATQCGKTFLNSFCYY